MEFSISSPGFFFMEFNKFDGSNSDLMVRCKITQGPEFYFEKIVLSDSIGSVFLVFEISYILAVLWFN